MVCQSIPEEDQYVETYMTVLMQLWQTIDYSYLAMSIDTCS